jgi:hypothetical protein
MGGARKVQPDFRAIVIRFRSFASPEKEKYFLFIYEVITWGKRKKSSAIHY